MLASLAMPGTLYHQVPLFQKDLQALLRTVCEQQPESQVNEDEVNTALMQFYDDDYALHCHRV